MCAVHGHARHDAQCTRGTVSCVQCLMCIMQCKYCSVQCVVGGAVVNIWQSGEGGSTGGAYSEK